MNVQRDQIVKEIQATNALLQKSKEKSNNILHQFQLLQNQISNREKLISNYNLELKKISNDIVYLNGAIKTEKEKLDRIKKEYGKMLQQYHRSNLVQNKILLLLSSANFNQAMARWQYFRQISNFRKNQKSEIQEIQQSLVDKQNQLEVKKQRTTAAKDEKLSQKNNLSKEMATKDKMLQDVKKDIAKLNQTIAQKEKERKALSAKISRLIAENNTALPSTPATTALSSNFEKNKGKLPWPTDAGIILRKYGEQAHPILKNIKVVNDGIDIQTEAGSKVYNVFEGRVIEAVFVAGFNMVVLVNHGSYNTVYSNLSQVNVVKNQQVGRQDILGVVGENNDGVPVLHFEIWKKKQVQNPLLWIKNR
ncbi:peptidoglycan DD-metalloendopeptidase family protein [Membranihabitans marinus]